MKQKWGCWCYSLRSRNQRLLQRPRRSSGGLRQPTAGAHSHELELSETIELGILQLLPPKSSTRC